MKNIKTLTAGDIDNPAVLVEAMNGIFKEYRDAIAGLVPKDDLEKVNAKLIVEANGLKDLMLKQGSAFDEHKKTIIDLTETIKIQGESITKLKTAFSPDDRKPDLGDTIVKMITKDNVLKDFVDGKTSTQRFEILTKDVAFGGTYGSGAANRPINPGEVFHKCRLWRIST